MTGMGCARGAEQLERDSTPRSIFKPPLSQAFAGHCALSACHGYRFEFWGWRENFQAVDLTEDESGQSANSFVSVDEAMVADKGEH